jgi:methionyl-tRNA formyltransferase
LFFFLNKRAEIVQTEEKLSLEQVSEHDPDLIVSYGYRHIIKPPVTKKYDGRMINLHISYLPWNRGAHPNAWSFIEKTPKGVSIHLIDEGVDTGDILFQKKVFLRDNHTLKDSYEILQKEIEDLFIKNWKDIKKLRFDRVKQDPNSGSYHTRRETEKYLEKLGINNWEVEARELIERSDKDIINDIQDIRAKNNTHWMDLVKLAFEVAPTESRDIFKKIKYCDEKVNELLKELAEND